MPNYANAKVYALTGPDDVAFYIGSTTTALAVRLQSHKRRARKWPNRKVYAKMAEIGSDNVEIKLICMFPCETVDALNDEERRHIEERGMRERGCNMHTPGARKQDGSWHSRNRERSREQNRAYDQHKRAANAAARAAARASAAAQAT